MSRVGHSAAFLFLIPLWLLLATAPVFRGGNRPLPLLGLELLALCILAFMVYQRHRPWTLLGRWERVSLALIVAIPLLSLLPVPISWWGALPGRQIYLDSLTLFGQNTLPQWQSLSVVHHASLDGLLTLLPPLTVFMAVLACGEKDRVRLVYLFLIVAALEAVLGLAQYGTQSKWLLFGMEDTFSGSAQGTYPNRNHLAGLFEMAIPLAAALFAANFGQIVGKSRRYHRKGLRSLIARLGESRINTSFVFIGLFLLLGLAMIFSRSRTGIALLIIGTLLSTLLFAPRLGGKQTLGTAAGIVALVAGLAIAVGLVPVLQRFTDQDPLADARWPIAVSTVEGIGAFFPLGAGVGTYPDVYRRFHPAEVPRFVNHAHNDYLEWLFEGGLLAGLAILLFALLYARRFVHVLGSDHWRLGQYIQVGAAIGVLLISLHGFVDYNLRIPANAIYFAFLLGLLFAHHEQPAKSSRPASSATPEDPHTGTPQLPTPAAPSLMSQPSDDIPNPFARD